MPLGRNGEAVVTNFLFWCLVAYIVGSIPSGKIIAKLNGVNIQSVGTKNIGASNTYLVLGKKAGFLVLFLDAGKAYIMMAFAFYMLPVFQAAIVSIILLFGNISSVFLKFSGGKGVATALGIFLATEPLVSLLFVGLWFLGLFLIKYLWLVNVIGAGAVPFSYYYMGHEPIMAFAVFILCVILFIRHRSQLKVLTENVNQVQEV